MTIKKQDRYPLEIGSGLNFIPIFPVHAPPSSQLNDVCTRSHASIVVPNSGHQFVHRILVVYSKRVCFDVITKNQTMGSVKNFFEKVFCSKTQAKTMKTECFDREQSPAAGSPCVPCSIFWIVKGSQSGRCTRDLLQLDGKPLKRSKCRPDNRLTRLTQGLKEHPSRPLQGYPRQVFWCGKRCIWA